MTRGEQDIRPKALYSTNDDKWKTTVLCSSCLIATGFPVDVFDYRKRHMITQTESCLAIPGIDRPTFCHGLRLAETDEMIPLFKLM